MMDKKTAQALADTLAVTLGQGWTSRLWENLGWHYKVVSPCGRWFIHSDEDQTTFTAFLGEADRHGGGRWARGGNTPQLTMRAVVEVVEREIEEIVQFSDIRLTIPRAKRIHQNRTRMQVVK